MSTRFRPFVRRGIFPALLLAACESPMSEPPTDMTKPPDPVAPRCSYEAAPVPTGTGMPIVAGEVRAGVGEAPLDLPVGTPLAGYTARMRLLGGSAPDLRRTPHAKAFAPSVGVQTRPLARALYLSAGSEPVVFVKADICLAYERLVYDVEKALAAQGLMPARGHVILSTSHTHSGPGTYHGAFHLALGLDQFQEDNYQRLVASLVKASSAAIKSAAAARVGVGIWDGWDANDEIYSDRRDEDDGILGPDGKPIGKHKEQRLLLLRVDTEVGAPLAVVTSFPIHGTTAGEDNPLISVDAPGHIELAVEERFDRPVLAMHIQSSAGDVSPRGRGGLGACDDQKMLCADYAKMESVGELAAPRIHSLWQATATTNKAALEIVSRSVRNGRDISVRNNLSYAPYMADVEVDTSKSAIYTPDGKVRSPITQFNVQAGAGLCGGKKPMLPVDGIPGAKDAPYASCADIGQASKFIANILRVDPPAEGMPNCETTRTLLSALRLDSVPVLRRKGGLGGGSPVDEQSQETLLMVTLPGEPVTLLADALRKKSPVGAERTFVLGYSQGHVGYILGVENWLLGGYEPSINIFGPLEGEWLMERALDLSRLALTPTRDDSEAPDPSSGGARFDRLLHKPGALVPATRSPSPNAGTVPTTLPVLTVRTFKEPPTQAQPAATLARVSGRATFVFYGGDPEEDLPEVTLEQETMPGVYAAVKTRSGRTLGSRGKDVLLTYTPDPIDVDPDKVKSHVWAVEWQAVGWERGALGSSSPFDVPAGKYRFSVRGVADQKPYQLVSQSFSVSGENALKLAVTRTGSRVSGQVSYPVGAGYRLLRLDGPSNGDVGVSGQVTVKLRSAAGPSDTKTVTLVNGALDLDTTGLDPMAGLTVEIEDRYGNRGQKSW